MIKNKSLNQIANELVVTNYSLELNQGEIDAVLENEIIALQNELATKVDHYKFRLEKLESLAEFWKAQMQDAKNVKDAIENHIDRMKETIKHTMTQLQTNELVGEKYKFKIRPSKPRLDLDVAMLSQEYKMQVTEWVPDKEKIRAALEAGQVVEGASLEQGVTLATGINKEK